MDINHSRFLELIDEIEATFRVAEWHIGDVPLWPLARAALSHNFYRQRVGQQEKDWLSSRRRQLPARVLQAASYATTPLVNVWSSRRDLSHLIIWPRAADALFLGDGVFLDQVDGTWRDRLCQPIIETLARTGRSALLMQSGQLRGLRWSLPTFPANTIDHWSRLAAVALNLTKGPEETFPDHELFLKFLNDKTLWTYGLTKRELRRKAATVRATAYTLEQLLKIVRPTICFMVKYDLGVGHALALACRRRGVLSVDLQHNRQDGHEAYRWPSLPKRGYEILPAVFWNWTTEDCTAIDSWTKTMEQPWHRSLYGGHPQFAAWFDNEDLQTRTFDAKVRELCSAQAGEIHILVALQNLKGYYDQIWNALAALVERSPENWRWWLRRHPAAHRDGNEDAERLLSIRRPNVIVGEASSFPLPALLRHMDIVLSLYSGAAFEASLFGLQSIFLTAGARELFPRLIKSGKAEVIDDMASLEFRLASVRSRTKTPLMQPQIGEVLAQLKQMSIEYAELCRRA